jgi:selenocysteine lyase/cysteine desulfurase
MHGCSANNGSICRCALLNNIKYKINKEYLYVVRISLGVYADESLIENFLKAQQQFTEQL